MGFLLLIRGLQLAASVTDQPPGRIGRDQRDNPGAFGFGEAGLSSGTRAVAEPVYPLGVEAVDAFAHGLRMASEFGGDPRGAQAPPAEQDHSGAQYPVRRGMSAVGELSELALSSAGSPGERA